MKFGCAATLLSSVTLLLLSSAEAAPPEDTAAPVPRFSIESYELANGLKVALSHDPSAPRTTVCVAYHVGSKNERPGLTGFAHFFEHMMFRGTKNVPDFDIPLQQAGGSPNAFTSEDMTIYFETVPNQYVKRALYMEAERMAFLVSALDQEKFDTEREVVKNERRQRMENVPYGLADETISSCVYPQGHPYSWSVIGSMKDLNNATLDDLRQFFLEFYHPRNATLTLVGGFDLQAAKEWVETYFGPISPGPSIVPLDIPETPGVAQRIVQYDRVQNPRVYWSWPTVAESDPDAPALDLLAMILADGDASRLRQSLVNKTHTAVETSANNESGEIGGMFKLYATIAAGKTVDEVEELIASTIDAVRAEGVSEAEVARIKAKYRTDMLVGLTSPIQRTFVIGMGLAQHNDPHYYQSLFTRYDAVTADDIQRVAQEYLGDDKMVLVVEPVQGNGLESEAVIAGPLASPGNDQTWKLREHAAGPDWSHMPDATQQQPFTPPAFERHVLDNGLEVWTARWQTLPLVSTRLLVRAGSSANSPDQAGLAALTAELWDQGTQDLDSTEFAEAIDALGTSLSVSAGTNTTLLGFTVETRAFADVLNLVGDMVARPRFADDDFAREKSLQLSNLVRGPDSASWIAGRVFPTLLYGIGHPYAIPDDGFTTTVDKLSVADVRSFYTECFTPHNAVLILVGDFEADETIALLEKSFDKWEGEAPPAETVAPAPVSKPGVVYVVDKPGAVQSVIAAGRVWKDRKDESYFATRIGNRIFGGDFLSRLNQNLRQRNGFTYGARSGFEYNEQGSSWSLSTSVRAEVTGAALREIVNELRDVHRNRPLTAEEVSVAKSAEMSVFPQSFETPSSIASSLAQLAVYELPDDYYQHFLQNLGETTPDAVAQAMSQVVAPARLRVLIVGDRAAVSTKLKEAQFETIEYLDTDGHLLQQ